MSQEPSSARSNSPQARRAAVPICRVAQGHQRIACSRLRPFLAPPRSPQLAQVKLAASSE
eukprot:826370-Pleurochrysis_carterae.AAC.3